jgi:putative transposase
LFGEIVDGQMLLNPYGHIVQEEWEKSAHIRNEIDLDAFVIMPNHIHGIFIITDRSERATGRSPLQFGPARQSLGAFIGGFKSAVTKRINERRSSPRVSVWQRNYFEHVIRNEESLQRIREYIFNNPPRWEFDRENPEAQHIEAEYAWRD